MKASNYIWNAVTSVWQALTKGQATKANSIPVTLASDQEAIKTRKVGEFETVAASQTAQVLGATGAAGDYLDKLIIVPATVNAGAVDLLSGATSINIFPGGTASLTELRPIVVPVEAISVGGAWKITTGANVSVIGIGDFT